MHTRTLLAALALVGATLMVSQAHAWRAGPWNAPAAYNHFRPMDNRPFIIRGINFQQDSDMLTHESTLILDAVATTLNARPMHKLQVIGHTSAEGDADYNLKLSKRRAKAVRDWLIYRGVPAENLGFSGYGEMYPLASNATDAGRFLNRRVELAPVMAPVMATAF